MSKQIKTTRRGSGFMEGFWNRGGVKDYTQPEAEDALPMINIMNTEEQYTVEVGAPGFRKYDYSVNLDNNSLVITAERESSTQSPVYSHQEFNYTKFERILSLPGDVVQQKVRARFKEGILYVDLPREEHHLQSKRKVEIQ